jgi:tetratricopeptide (TPR) repeat protein
LAISYQFLGNIEFDLGNLNQSLAYYEKFNLLEKELFEAFPDKVEFKHGLAVTYEKLAQVHTELGNIEQALQLYLDGARLLEELNETFPNNVEFKKHVAVSHYFLGGFQKDYLGDIKMARSYFLKAQDHLQSLLQIAPSYKKSQKFLTAIEEAMKELP